MTGKRERLYLKRFFSFVITLFFTALFCSISYGKDKVNLGLVGRLQYSGDILSVEILQNDTLEEKYILCGTSTGLFIFDVADPNVPKEKAFLEIGEVKDIALYNLDHGTYAALANRENGLSILNITDPTVPTYAGGIDTSGEAYGVAISGNYAYIADNASGLVIIDITDPTVPIYTGGIDTSGNAYDVAISGNYAYIADNASGLVFIDITDPTVPTYAGGIDTSGYTNDVFIAGNYAYVADGSNGLIILDITDPTVPTYAGGIDTSGYANDVFIAGNYAYVADGSNGLIVLDITDPTVPTYAGGIDTPGYAYDLAVFGNYTYVATRSGGLEIINITDPTSPSFAGRFYPSWDAKAIAISGNYAYVANGYDGLKIIDISQPSRPAYIGGLDTSGEAYNIAISDSGDYAYIAEWSNGLVIIDITEPTDPTYAGRFDTSSGCSDMVISGNYAYMAGLYNGLVIVDVTDPNAPTYAGSFEMPDLSFGIAVDVAITDSGNYACVAYLSHKLVIIDITDPNNPDYAGVYDTYSWAIHVDISGDYAYVTSYSGLEVLDITEPKNPTYIGGFDTGANDIAFVGNYAYMASNGLEIIDISNPNIPTYIGRSDKRTALSVDVSGNYAFAAHGDNGLSIYQIIDTPTIQGNLILCAGGPASTTNPFWPPSQTLASLAYSSFLDQGYPDYFIYYLNPNPQQDINKDGSLDPLVVDDFTPTVDDIKYAITDWAYNQLNTGPLYIYLIGQGAEDQFQIMPGQVITTGDLKECIDKFQNGYTDDEGTYHPGTNREVVFIIESTASDTFIDDLTGDNITVITSDGDGLSYTDVDVTFIDRVPNYPYDADKNTPDEGDTITFVAHLKLSDRPYLPLLQTNYIWYMDGMPMGDGIVQFQQGQDNTVSIDWIWDNKRHEIMIVLDPENSLIEQSEENNILYDFTDALIVGMAVERGLVDVFPDFQRDLGIGSLSFEDWFQRQVKIWNMVLMEKAGELKSDSLFDIQDRVRGVISYHEDGSLKGGNCPLVWKDVDMLWGKLASDIQGYSENNWAWFYEGSLPHELSHARYLPDTYILDLPASFIEIIDDSGFLVTDTYYMPPFSWDVVYYNKNQGMMSADYAGRYSLFDGYLLNRIAGERAQGCNTNGCCSHDTNWYALDFPEAMYLRILRLDGSPWMNARLDIYTRQGTYGNSKVDNIIDYTLYTDSSGRALLPSNAFTNYRQEFVLKINSPDGYLREYRFVERTNFHIAYWAGSKDSFDYTIKTDFDPVPFADKVENVSNHKRGETFDLTFKGRNFKEGGYIRFSNSEVMCNNISYINENEVRVNITIPENNVRGSIAFRLYNPDGKFVRVKSPYEQGLNIVFENTKPYARFTAYDIGNRIPGAYYFNGLWSDDWGRLFKGIDGPLPMEGTGPIASYEWDFGDGSPYSDEPYTIHNYSVPGTYHVTLTVTDMDRETASITKTVVVTNQIFYRDIDEDTYGNPNVTCLAFTQPDGYVLNNLDCNDNDPNTYTGAIEQCDGKDNDCDGSPGPEEVDADGDIFMVCEGDCNDADPNINPEATEICDGKDNDCDGDIDEGCTMWQMKQRDMYNTGRAKYHVPFDKLNDSFFDVYLWQKPSPGPLGSTSMPFYDRAGPEGRDIVVGNYHWPKGIQGMDRQTGQLFWSGNPRGGERIGAITAAFSNDGKVIYVVNDSTGSELYPNGHPLMAFKTSSGPSTYWHNGSNPDPGHLVSVSPTVSPDGRIFLNAWADRPYAGTDTGDAIIETWAASTYNHAGHSNPALYHDGNQLIVVSGGRWGYIRAYDGETGDELWGTNVGAMVDASVTIDPENGNIYVGCGNSDIYVAGLDKEGNPLWENPSVLIFDYMEGQNNPQRAQAAGCLSHDSTTYYFQTNSNQGDGRLYAINTLDSSLKWSFETHSKGWEMISSSPIVTENGIIIVGNNDGGTYFAIRNEGLQGTLLDTIMVDEAGNARASATLSSDGILCLPLRTFWIAGNGDGDVPDYNIENLFCAIDLTSEGTMKLYPPPYQTAVTLNHGMSLSWQPITDPTRQFDHYAVYRATNPFSSIEGMTPIGSVYDFNNTHYTDDDLSNGISYYYAITTISKDGGKFMEISSIGPRTPRDETDLQIVCIARTPRFPRYAPIYTRYEITEPSGFGPYIFSAATGLGNGQDESTQRWPNYGDPVTYTAKIRNRGTNTLNSEINGIWRVDGSIVKESSLVLMLASGDEFTFEYELDWDEQSHEIAFSLDVADERYENNELVINTKSVPFLTYLDISYIEEFRESAPQYPDAVTDDFIDWLNHHMRQFNQMFANAGCLKRVHYDILEVLNDFEPDPDIDRQPFAIFPFRFHAGEGNLRKAGYYDQSTDIDNGLLHEMGHQLGLIDLYQMDLSGSRNYVSGQGYMAPPGLMHGCSPFISQHSALGMNHWLDKAHGYYGQYMYNIPAEIRLRILDFNGDPLEGATVKMYQYCERPGLGKVITDQIKAQGTTDSNGEFILPNVPLDHEKVPLTYIGDELQDNPFGYLAVVGTNGVLHFRVEYGPGVDYAWLDITEANIAYFTGQKDIAIFERQLALGGPVQYCPPDDMTELNAQGWSAWAEGSDSENTYVEDDMIHKLFGNSSLKFTTNGGFDTYVRYPRNVSALWDLTNADYLEISFFAVNPHIGFQSGSPWIRLKDAENNYFQYQYYRNGHPYDLLNEARNTWLDCRIPLDASSTTDNGWRLSIHGSPSLNHIQYIEIHSDTWGYGFTLWLDGVSFDPRPKGCCDADVNNDCVLDAKDLVIINRYLQGFPNIVPSSWRDSDPNIPSDEEISIEIDECKTDYDMDTTGGLTVRDLVIIYRCILGFPSIVPTPWRESDPNIPPDSEIAQAVEALKPICSP